MFRHACFWLDSNGGEDCDALLTPSINCTVSQNGWRLPRPAATFHKAQEMAMAESRPAPNSVNMWTCTCISFKDAPVCKALLSGDPKSILAR